jgi:hypothetical protein
MQAIDPLSKPSATLVTRLWQSNTAMAWTALSARALGIVVLLPLALYTFSPEVVGIWLILNTITALQSLCDLGLEQTFTRVIAYRQTEELNARPAATADELSLRPIAETIPAAFLILAVISAIVVGLVGTWYLGPLIAATANPTDCWSAWAVVVLGGSSGIWGLHALALLNGMHQVALVRRWEALTVLASVISGAVVLVSGSSLFALVAATHFWIVLGSVHMAWRARNLLRERLGTIGWRLHAVVLRTIWPAAWRSQLGVLASFGTLHAAALIYARIVSASEAAPLLLALRILFALVQFSQPPFYTRIPLLATLYAGKQRAKLLEVAVSGIRGSCWVFAAGAGAAVPLVPSALEYFESRTHFVSPLTWALLAVAFFMERTGSMHLQFCAVTNRINWHIANGATALVFIVSLLVLLPVSPQYAIPCAMLLAYGGFLFWFSADQLRRYFSLNMLRFAAHTSLFPGIALATALAISTVSF